MIQKKLLKMPMLSFLIKLFL